jgi:Kef-type K+ transport system membrane component KefB
MTSGFVFLIQVFLVVILPLGVLRLSRLKGLVPLVVVQIVVGIALGPSLFGRVAPDYYLMLFNDRALLGLSGIASVALLFFGLITGLHLAPSTFRDRSQAFVFLAASNVVVPTVSGCLVAFWIVARYPQELRPGIGAWEFALAIGICIGMTALPVLSAILHEMDLLESRIGHLALAIAGINDAALWIMLGLLLAAVSGQVAGGLGVLATLMLVPVYLVIMVRFVRPLLARQVTVRMRDGKVRERALAVVAAVTIASALAMEAMGLHFFLGAFVAGVVMPDHLRKPILDQLHVLTLTLLMPFFFTLAGIRTVIDLSSLAFVQVFIVSTVVAVVAIVGGTAIAARLVGESWQLALALGALLQTKGLMELIVLSVLRDAKIITDNVFVALTLMAVFSTALAMPMTRSILRAHRETPGIDTGTPT